MASIEKRPDGTYRARWREFPGGPQKTKHFDRKGDAERFTDALRGDLARGVYIDPQAGRLRFQDYAEQWRAGQLHRRSTATQTETYLRLHAYPIFGHLPLGAVRRSDIQSWVKGRSEVLAPGSVELVYRWVATIFKSAVADRLIPASPCLRITLPKKTRAVIIPLSVEQVTLLADSMPRCYRALVLFSAGTGMRHGECFGLTVDRIDFLRRTVRVDRQLVGAVGGVPEFGPRKATPASEQSLCPRPSSPCSPHISQSTAKAHNDSSSPTPSSDRFGETRSTRRGIAPPTPTGFRELRPSMTCATSTHRCSLREVAR